ncbi:MAG: hypothetical protein EPN84_01755 [Legionella sp.]|nr:MAG: hypothetical protein EPN84_01755 [Legionella sp.]
MRKKLSTSHYTQLASPNGSISPEEWVNSVIDQVINTNRKKIAFFDNFPPQYVDYYKALQEAIAVRIPDEQDRPFICLKIQGSNRQNDKTAVDIGMAGGTGPLSDATALVNFVTHLSQSDHHELGDNRHAIAEKMQNFSGVMYSMPPPRDLSHAKANFKDYRHLYAQVRRDIPCSSLHILTNTGHSNKWVFDSSLFFGSKKHGRVDDMTETVAERIRQNSSGKVLILGTKAADKAQLYPKLLKARGLEPILPRENIDDTAAPVYLQKIIDQAKAGKVNEKMPGKDQTCGQAFIDFCVMHVNKTGATSLLFSCTEIPMLLHTIVPNQGNTYLEQLKEALPKNIKFKFYDSEEIFVEAMTEKSRTLQNNPSLRAKITSGETKEERLHIKLIKDIEKQIQSLETRAGKISDHKRNVLESTLNYLRNPTAANLLLLEDTQKSNPLYTKRIMIWGSKTVALVEDALELGKSMQEQKIMSRSSDIKTQLQSFKRFLKADEQNTDETPRKSFKSD